MAISTVVPTTTGMTTSATVTWAILTVGRSTANPVILAVGAVQPPTTNYCCRIGTGDGGNAGRVCSSTRRPNLNRAISCDPNREIKRRNYDNF